MQDFRNLAVWNEAYQLVLELYPLTRTFPQEELYGLTSQLRRCAMSIPANIAEGCGRQSDPDFSRFLSIAMGSASELECHLLLAHDLDMMDAGALDDLMSRLTRTNRMLNALIKRIRKVQ